jgi:aryl-alcohol dehydrogenase-like predicted oxidoreductase
MRRFVLGTVQLGLPYGRRAGGGLLTDAEAHRILDGAWDAGIRAFDTAESYGISAQRLAAWLAVRGHGTEAEVVTKIPVGDGMLIRGLKAVERFAGVKSRTLLSHAQALGPAWQALREVSDRTGTPVGQSVYGSDEVTAALACEGMARIQAPGNLFDGGALAARAGSGVPLDLRSVYLQGTLVEPPDSAERRAPGTGALARAVQTAARALGITPSAALIAAMLRQLGPGDRLVIGVDDPAQLTEIRSGAAMAAATASGFIERARALAPGTAPAATLDPRAWATAAGGG